MIIHFYFNFAKLIYSFWSRRDWLFVFFELFGAVAVLVLVRIAGPSIERLTHVLLPNDSTLSGMLFQTVWGILFVLFALISRLVVPKNPEELAPVKTKAKVIAVGIIDFSWIVMLGGAYSGILICRLFPVLESSLPRGMSEAYYKMYYDEVSYLFGRSIDCMLILGSILAACMTIIWGGELWRKRDNPSRKQYINTTVASMKMVIAFFAICIAIVLWITLPFYMKMSGLKDLLP